ncbi:hypothetical protein DFH07DRAFT_834174 [Mycena maculata]|uniref:Uncharacterized protein n=1 Tax=Mycena maculata TaxID=230809 RepID=A0AAD7N597_9AGAR|nr:hypothetical protein DFH07DRAFT_834174 [Mycena maculata]
MRHDHLRHRQLDIWHLSLSLLFPRTPTRRIRCAKRRHRHAHHHAHAHAYRVRWYVLAFRTPYTDIRHGERHYLVPSPPVRLRSRFLPNLRGAEVRVKQRRLHPLKVHIPETVADRARAQGVPPATLDPRAEVHRREDGGEENDCGEDRVAVEWGRGWLRVRRHCLVSFLFRFSQLVWSSLTSLYIYCVVGEVSQTTDEAE